MTTTDNAHDLWLHWIRTQRRSREDLITCRADRRTLLHMSLLPTSTPPAAAASVPTNESCSVGNSGLGSSTFATLGDVSDDDLRCHPRNPQPQSAFTSVSSSCDSRKPSSHPNDCTSFWTKQKQRIIKERKRLSAWNAHPPSLPGSAAPSSSNGTGTASTTESCQNSTTNHHTDASVATTTLTSNATLDSLRQLADLRISTSLVMRQEAIWNQIKNPVAHPDDTRSFESHTLDVKGSSKKGQSSPTKDKKRPPISAFGSKFKLYGKRVRVIPQEQVREAWKRGEAIEISCVVCETRLLTIADLNLGMVYCPECCAIAPFDVYRESTK